MLEPIDDGITKASLARLLARYDAPCSADYGNREISVNGDSVIVRWNTSNSGKIQVVLETLVPHYIWDSPEVLADEPREFLEQMCQYSYDVSYDDYMTQHARDGVYDKLSILENAMRL